MKHVHIIPMSLGPTRPLITLVKRQGVKLNSYCYLVLRIRMPVAVVYFPCLICLLGVQRDITGGINYLVRRFQNYFLKCRIHLFPNVGG